MNRRAAALSFVLAASLGATACRPDFAPYNRLSALRVLGIQSEPPTPFTGEATTLSALVFTPTPDPSLTYKWSWCPVAAPAADGYRCLVEEQQLDGYLAQAGLPPLPPFDLGAGDTALFTNSLDPAVLMAACAGLLPNEPSAVTVDCTAGFPAQIALTVTTDTDTVTAVQTLKLRFDPTTPANTNPTIDALTATVGGVTLAIDDSGAVTLPRDVETPVATAVAETAAEVYPDGTDAQGAPVTSTERLFTTWFVESGGTHDTRTSFISGSTSFPDLLKNTLTPATVKDYPGSTARIFTVIHDNRGGVSWRGGIVNLEAGP